ncbi:MAG: cytochrome c biogenesis protein CcdA [Candidatus Ornithospirochaeta sp.]
MNFSFVSDISALASFLEGILSFFSPCVLPLLPVYFSFLSGGNAERNENGEIIYKRSKVVINTIFFVLGISLTFFILSLGVKGVGKIFSTNSHLFNIIGGALIIVFGLWQLVFYGTKYGAKRDKRININTNRAKGPLLSFLLGFSFSFSWTPCIGPILSSVLIMASSSLKGELYLLSYSLGFTIPFILLGFFTSSLLRFFQKYRKVVKYSVRIGAMVMILLGLMMVISNIDTSVEEREALSSSLEMKEEVEEIDQEISSSIEKEEVSMKEEGPMEKENIENTESSSIEIENGERESDVLSIESVEEKPLEIENDISQEEREVSAIVDVTEGNGEIEIDNITEENKGAENTDEGVLAVGAPTTEEIDAETIEEAEPSDLELLSYSFLDQYGKIHRLSSYKGKVIFLNIWATWCGPCRSEMGEIEALYNKYKEREDVVILSVAFPNQSGEGNTTYIKSYMKDNGYTYPVLFDNSGKLLYILGIKAFPTTFLFDKEGNVYGYYPGAMDGATMEKLIEATLNSSL